MRYVSLFSGIEAASVAWGPLGFEPMAFSEIEPFPCKVLQARFPNVPNLGDICEVDWKGFVSEHGRPDVVVGGSPCQSFSVAGGRESLSGESRLCFEYVRAVREVAPAWLVWENVPGVLFTKDNAFGQFLAALWDCGYRDLSWRVLDAQFFGVAQRRRRVFVVGHLGDGMRSAAVLFERDSVRGDHPSSREKREELAAAAGRGAEGAGGCLTPWDCQSKRVFSPDGCAPTLSAGSGGGMCVQPSILVFKWHQGSAAGSIGCSEEQSPTLTADYHQPAVCYGIAGNVIGREDGNGGHQLGVVDADDNGMFTLNTVDRHAVAFAQNTRDEARLVNGGGQVAGALAASPGMKQQTYVLHAQETVSGIAVDEDLASPLKASGDKSPNVICMADGSANAAVGSDMCGTLKVGGTPSTVSDGYVVRRLTPLECERLQGFPDNWTKLEDDTPDTPRYKALGNSMAVPVMRWIGERLMDVEKIADGTER